MKKIMIVNTSSAQFGEHEVKTGLWLSELVHFYDLCKDHGIEMDLFSIKGGKTPLDPTSLNVFMLDSLTKSYYKNEDFMALLNDSAPLSEADPSQYDAIYFTGGHGVMFDFTHQNDIQHAIETIDRQAGIVAAVCHGIAALLNVKRADGVNFIYNKQLTGFSNTEEVLSGKKKYVPYMLETELKKQGANYKKAAIPLTSYVEVDGRLVTGQNPQSTKAVAEAVIQLLDV